MFCFHLRVRGPLGHFALDETSARPRCLIGAGCGFGPILSMLRHLADIQDMQPTTLIFAANLEDEMFGAEATIQQLQTALPKLTVMLTVWHPQGSWSGLTGTAADAFAAALDKAAELPDVYVCGPPALLESVKAVAKARGLPPTQIFTEQVQPG